MLPPVEHSPGHLTRVPLQDVSLVGSARQKPTEQEKLDNSKESKRYFIRAKQNKAMKKIQIDPAT